MLHIRDGPYTLEQSLDLVLEASLNLRILEAPVVQANVNKSWKNVEDKESIIDRSIDP
jgi:hypothetical protein